MNENKQQGMWLARDKDDNLYLYIGKKPIKEYRQWELEEIGTADGIIPLSADLFPEVQWSDEEPTKVKLEIEK